MKGGSYGKGKKRFHANRAGGCQVYTENLTTKVRVKKPNKGGSHGKA